MSVRYRQWLALLGAVAIAVLAAPSFPARAENRSWTGKYTLVGYADQKTGNSMAARQPEPRFSNDYVFATECSAGKCIATALAGPAPNNPTLPLPPRYTWDGTRWMSIVDWKWDCSTGDGAPKVWSPARSWTYYIPLPDGTLTGTWMTEIYGGPCEGSVMMPVAAVPSH